MLIPEQGTPEKVLLAGVEALTFTRGRLTTSRRTGPIAQLICDGGGGSAGCPKDPRWQFQTALCKNQGTGDDGQPQWECSADLPADGALGAVTVSCEGYDSPSDPYVLVGSCSLTYSLDAVGPWFGRGESSGLNLGNVIFFVIFGSFAIRILRAWGKPSRPPPPAYADPASPDGGDSSQPLNTTPDPAVLVTGEPVLATAVPVDELNHDVENNNASCSPSAPQKDQRKKKTGSEAGCAPAAAAAPPPPPPPVRVSTKAFPLGRRRQQRQAAGAPWASRWPRRCRWKRGWRGQRAAATGRRRDSRRGGSMAWRCLR
ncbi:unnamed protein product, partial [Ectocarpus sp. 8 AP-2014]